MSERQRGGDSGAVRLAAKVSFAGRFGYCATSERMLSCTGRLGPAGKAFPRGSAEVIPRARAMNLHRMLRVNSL